MNYTKPKLQLNVTYEDKNGVWQEFDVFGYDIKEMEEEAEKILKEIGGKYIVSAKEVITKYSKFI